MKHKLFIKLLLEPLACSILSSTTKSMNLIIIGISSYLCLEHQQLSFNNFGSKFSSVHANEHVETRVGLQYPIPYIVFIKQILCQEALRLTLLCEINHMPFCQGNGITYKQETTFVFVGTGDFTG